MNTARQTILIYFYSSTRAEQPGFAKDTLEIYEVNLFCRKRIFVRELFRCKIGIRKRDSFWLFIHKSLEKRRLSLPLAQTKLFIGIEAGVLAAYSKLHLVLYWF